MNGLKKWGKDDVEDDESGNEKTHGVSPSPSPTTSSPAAVAAQSAANDGASAEDVAKAAELAAEEAEIEAARLKDEKCERCRKMNNRQKKQNCKRRNRCGIEGFADSKGCSTKNAMKNMNFSRLLALSITGILAIISIFPILLPILSAGLTSLRVAGSLTFNSFEDIRGKLSGIEQYAAMIPIVIFILMGGKLLNHLMNGGLNGAINNL